MKWVWNYPNMKRPGVRAKLEELGPEKQVFILNSRRAVREFLDRLPN
ncbi:hypothetical protein ABID49_002244 [Bhargavaea ullalensis]|uniref:Uncharacterized protein n=1 Tax=Bhargavaea ullalensis TaxID=1265685 RepID=A0ABV2GDH3_9BACL